MDFLSWKALSFDFEGEGLTSPQEKNLWVTEDVPPFGRAPALHARPGDVDAGYGVHAATAAVAAEYGHDLYLVAPMPGATTEVALAVEGWRASAAFVVAGPFQPGDLDGFRAVWAAARAGYQVVPGVLCEAAVHLAGAREIARGEAATAIAVLVADTEPDVRRAAIQALRRIGGPEARATLAASVVADKDPDVRLEAVRALAVLGGPEAQAALAAALAKDTSPRIRLACVWAMCDLGRPEALPALAAALAAETHEDVCRGLVWALVGFKKPEAQAALAATLTSDARPAVRAEAARALASLYNPEAQAAIAAASLADPDETVRETAREALEQLLQ